MMTITTTDRKNIFALAWQFVRRNGYTLSEALTTAWRNIKLRKALTERICKFTFQKVDGSIRQAFGTLADSLIPATSGSDRRRNDTVQVYFDTEKGEYRCFKRANLLSIG